MAYSLGQRSLSFCTRVDPRLMAVAKLAISLSTQDFGFTAEQSRTVAEEAEEVAKGFSHTMHSHHLINDGSLGWEVTPSAVGFSGAVDAVPWNGTTFVWDWPLIYPIAVAFKAASLQLSIPVTWGGGFWGKLLSETPGDDATAMEAAHNAGGGFDGPHHELGRN
jgi:peptidoglycan L-alanyl-D-glutamate endopeptidase CwlK